MSMSDPIADMLTRIRNAQLAEKTTVQMPTSKVKVAIAKVLKDEGYVEGFAVVGEGAFGAFAARGEDAVGMGGLHAPGRGRSLQPCGCPLGAEREGRGEAHRAASLEALGGLPEEGLRQEEAGVWPDGGDLSRTSRREEVDLRNAEVPEKAPELVFDDVRKGADHQQGWQGVGLGSLVDQGREAGVLTLGEGGLDTAPGVVDHPGRSLVAGCQPGGGAGEVELDHLGRARSDEEQHLDVGPPGQELVDHAVQLVVGVGHPCQIALLHDRGRKAGLCEHHHAGGGLDQVGAGSRSDDEEEGVLDLAVQPHDAREAAEDLPLAALAQHRTGGFRGVLDGGDGVHGADPV